MTCEYYREVLVAFHDNELSESEAVLLNKHLQECRDCSQELAEIRQFAQSMHKATALFRESVQKISVPQSVARPSFRMPAWAAIAAAFLLIASFFYLKFSGPDLEQLASWGIQHYALVDQVHPVHGNADAVQAWFQEHHQLSVRPPMQIDYSRLTGCKVTEMNSQPVALLRVEDKPVKALFILPQKSVLLLRQKVLYRDGYQIEFWQEHRTLYMSLSAVRS